MCGRYAASADEAELVEEFDIDEVAGEPPPASWNIAPTDPVTAVVQRVSKTDGQSRRKLVPLRWGLVPSWAKDPKGGARLINARAETVAEKPSFRKAFAARRCLLPADGYYEWYATEAPPGGKPGKQPYFIHRGDGERLVMAGIYEFWRDDARPADDPDAWLSTCSIITTSATDALGHLHDRMPMVIARDAWADWLDPELTDPAAAQQLLHVTDAELLTAYPVSKAVGNIRNNSPDLVEPIEAP